MLHLSKVETLHESYDVFCKCLVRLANKLFEVKVFVPFMEQWSKPVSESTSLRDPLQYKCLTKIIVSKFLKVSIFNGNTHKGLNTRKNKRFYL